MGGRYDLIWNQWCLGHLTDAQLVDYLRRCGRYIKRSHEQQQQDQEQANDKGKEGEVEEAGWIVVKENLSTDPQEQDIYDEVDRSVPRTDEKFRSIFEKAGLVVVRSENCRLGFRRGWGLYPVRMYGLRPKK